MRILVDENIPRMTVKSLVEMGHDVKDIRGSTIDKGFIQYRYARHNGILIVRLKQPNRLKICNRSQGSGIRGQFFLYGPPQTI